MFSNMQNLAYTVAMTEFENPFRDDAQVERVRHLHSAFADLQEITSRFMMKEGRSINEMTVDELQALVDRIAPHLDFELESSEEIAKGMPIIVSGAGAFLIADQDGELIGAQVSQKGDVLTGVISDVQALIVPVREAMMNPDLDNEIPVFDLSLSAIVAIDGATFSSSPTPDGTFEVVHDLGEYSILIPVVYGMDARIADIAA